MPKIPFSELPDEARIWVFGASRAIAGVEAEHLVAGVETFIQSWLAHGQAVVGAFEWRYDRLLIVGADEAATGVSGCSIDALYRTLKAAEGQLRVSLLDSSLILYRDAAGNVQAVPRPEFRRLIANGDIGPETTVFDNTVATAGALRNGEWERPLHESWHGRAFLAAHR
ncbi:MAG: hypothetical protein WD737_05710 [Gemmatimonadota bacterium]